MRISHEAIYQALYVQGRGALQRELVACLRSGRALRVPRARARQKAWADVSTMTALPRPAPPIVDLGPRKGTLRPRSVKIRLGLGLELIDHRRCKRVVANGVE